MAYRDQFALQNCNQHRRLPRFLPRHRTQEDHRETVRFSRPCWLWSHRR